MQEEVTQRTVALCVESTKLSAGMLQQAMKKVLDEMQKRVTSYKTKIHHGKQTLQQLMKHNISVSNIEITDQNIWTFSATAKKYGIDFALKKDASSEIPRYLVFWMPMSSRRPSVSSPQRTWRKTLILNLPYLLFVYLFDKLCQAVRLAPGLDTSEKFLHLSQGFTEVFSYAAPSLHP